MARALETIELPADERALAALPALALALDGTGPALLPVAAGADPPIALPGDATVEDPVALVVATSGSTGEPKGVLLPATALRASAAATQARLGGPAQWLLAVPPHNVAGVLVLVRSVLAGIEPVVMDLVAGFRAGAFVEATGRLRGSRRNVSLVPTQLARVLDDDEAAAALATYDAVLVGGAATPVALLDRARDAGISVVTTYGMTETCGGCVYDGRPLDGVTVDADGGLLRIRGPVVASGYRDDPVRSAEYFVDGWFRTTDRGRIQDDGTVEVHGRADDVVVTGGANVAPAAVEAALLEHPGVAAAGVFGRADDTWGQRVVAVVVPRGTAPSYGDLRAHVAERAGRAGAPRELVLVEALPQLSGGKLDRVALRTLRGEVWEG